MAYLNTLIRRSGPLLVAFLCAGLLSNAYGIFAEAPTQDFSQTLMKLDGEIVEVEELREPEGSAIYTVKDLATGKTLRLFAHSYRTLVRMGTTLKTVGDVLGGSKVTIIYRNFPGEDVPEIIFVKVTSSYYS